MTANRTAKKTAATPTPDEPKRSRTEAPPAATILAYKVTPGENQAGEHHDDLVDVVPFGHRQTDEMTALRWAMGRGYFVATVPAGVSLREHLRTEATS